MCEPKRFPISLVVAATQTSLAIGKSGTLPWRLRKDMAFFKHVTSSPQIKLTGSGNNNDSCTMALPAVIMGRKSWESIPAKFRPLPNRVNVIISRSQTDFGPGTIAFTSLAQAVDALCSKSTIPAISAIYIIGGAQIYREAFKYNLVSRIFLTLVRCDEESLECDTFLTDFRNDLSWTKKSHDELKSAVQFLSAEALDIIDSTVPPNCTSDFLIKEGAFEYEFTMWDRN
ncbi:dihydrofolate reductase-like domain-containing protein [Dipodascopsis uninucleata]